jgi:hypothetical protein
MFKGNIFIILILLVPVLTLQAQDNELIEDARLQLKDRGEIYFCFVLQKSFSIEYLSDLLSIDRLSNDTIFAYSNEEQFDRFLKLQIPFKLLIPPSLLFKSRSRLKTTSAWTWDTYPAYREYVEIMQKYAQDFSDLCQLVEIGESVGGKNILALNISDN